MLFNSDDNENKPGSGKLFNSDNSSLDNPPAAEQKENSLFGSPLNNTVNNSSHDSLFETSYEESDIRRP